MHHSKFQSHILAWSVLAGLALAAWASAQQPPAPAARDSRTPGMSANSLIVPINGTTRLQMSSKRRISKVVNSRESVARVQAVDENTILIIGLDAGVTEITLTDEMNHSETYTVTVQFDVEYLRTILQRAVPTGNIQPLPGANGSVVLTGTVAHAEDVDIAVRTAISMVGGQDRVVNALRVGGVQQVQLNVVVAQVNRSKMRQFGFNLLASGPSVIFGSTTGGLVTVPTAGTVPPVTFANGNGGGGASMGSNSSTGLLTGGGISANPGNVNLFLGAIINGTSYFNFLQALTEERVAKLLAEPRVLAIDGRPASFLSGGEQAVPVPAGLGQVGIQFEEFGVRLNFLPIVLGNGRIHLEVEPEVSALNAANGVTIQGTSVPGRTTQRVHTSVEMETGQTFAIGGLIQHGMESSIDKVPVLGDLPFVGTVFSTKQSVETDNEIVILVTPYLVDAMACDQVPKVLPGQETRSPDDFELFLEGILEAPRGPRKVCSNNRYVPAFKNGPTAGQFPCAADGRCGTTGEGRCTTPGCAAGEQPRLGTPAKVAVPEPVGGIKPVRAEDPAATSAVTPEAAAGPAPVLDSKPAVPATSSESLGRPEGQQ